jgi:alanyl-tRNA synthetase
VRPDKLRFDFTHGTPMAPAELRDVEDQVNAWILENRPVRALHTTRARAEEMGAMALFGEKYGDEVRVVEVEAVSRELCGGTHVATTSEIGVFKILSEGSSAANVRRIEAVTGPAGVKLFRDRDSALTRIAGLLRTRPEDAERAVEAQLARQAELERERKSGGAGRLEELAASLAGQATEVGGVKVIAARCDAGGADELRELSDRLKSSLGEAAVVLGAAENGRPVMVASFTGGVVERGLSAATVVKEAARLMGGGGGGRDTMAQAGGKSADKLEDALAAARTAIEAKLA